MEQQIRDRYNKTILSRALAAYEIAEDDIQELDGFESYIYAFERKEGEGILRISHSIRRTPDLIRGELDWINTLHAGGVGVARPLQSTKGDWVEVLQDEAGGSFLAAAFEKAPGKPPHELNYLKEYGSQIGKMHDLAKTYLPKNQAWRRLSWDDPVMLEIDQFLPVGDTKIKAIYHELQSTLKTLEVDRDGYGLIHQDAHQGNFFVDESGKITFFDFDDCVYSWFVNDIALVLFYAVMRQDDPAAFTENFLRGFLPGYFSANSLDPKWFCEIPHFMKLREIDLYAVIHRSFDVENLEDPWCAWYLDGRKEGLENEIPYLDYDFESFDVRQYI